MLLEFVLNSSVPFRFSQPVIIKDKYFPLELRPSAKAKIPFICEGKDFGRNKILVIFEFEDFSIGTHIVMEVRDELLDTLQSHIEPRLDPFGQNTGQFLTSGDKKIVKGQRKKSSRAAIFTKRKLGDHPIPKRFQNLYYDDDASALLDHFPYLGEDLSFENYKDKFSNLLYLEEMEQTEQMAQFSLSEMVFEVRQRLMTVSQLMFYLTLPHSFLIKLCITYFVDRELCSKVLEQALFLLLAWKHEQKKFAVKIASS